MYIIVQNFTPVSAAVAKISVTGQRKTRQPIYYIACHTDVWRVTNKETVLIGKAVQDVEIKDRSMHSALCALVTCVHQL